MFHSGVCVIVCRRTTTDYAMSAIAFDLGHPDIVARELAEANRRLAREPEVGPSIKELVRDLADASAS